MRKNIELLSPVGDFECLKSAVQNGADSVYFGGSFFNARASASNFDSDELKKAIDYCAIRGVKTHLTLNILIKDHEFKDAVSLALEAYRLGIDAIIVQDLGLAKYLIKHFPDLPIHASTQMTVHNLEGVKQLEKLGFKRAVLSRELSIEEIEYICANSNIEIETFIHGALCISYSGQCLFSSMVGGRSGNRGKCAQPCRLPYSLIERSNLPDQAFENKVLDKGYLLSPRDLCSLEYLPSLIHAGVKCFKIEGRLKSPEYVATVTRIYRKYMDMVLDGKEYVIDPVDKKELMQVFNRGGFSSGHLDAKPNQNLIFKEKPNHMGLYLGNVSHINQSKGHITVILNEKLAIGDTIGFEKETSKYTVSELMKEKSNLTTAETGMRVTIGRMKGNISVGDKIYKLASKTLSKTAQDSFNDCENIKVPLKTKITIKQNTPIKMEVSFVNAITQKLNTITVQSDIIPMIAENNPITKERIISQITKTNNTPFEFREIDIELDHNLYVPGIRNLNELRRMALSKVEEQIIANHMKNRTFSIPKQNHFDMPTVLANKTNSRKKISVLLNTINLTYDYTKLDSSIHRIYIPLKHFVNKAYSKILKELTSKFRVYIYMPSIIKNNYKNLIMHQLSELLDLYPIKGFVISSIADLTLLEKYKNTYEFIGNYTLNCFNMHTLKEYEDLGLKQFTLSPELSLNDIEHIGNFMLPTELIVYGKTPVMTSNYCLLGSSNKCYPNCLIRCRTNNQYYLKDRFGFEFRIMPDNIQTVTTIYNSKITCITHIATSIPFARIDILDESIDEINQIISATKRGKKLEGSQYTYGNLNREV